MELFIEHGIGDDAIGLIRPLQIIVQGFHAAHKQLNRLKYPMKLLMIMSLLWIWQFYKAQVTEIYAWEIYWESSTSKD